ncbi:MAG: patatin-like phospholipase family protein [Dehalococcoidia bacterium]
MSNSNRQGESSRKVAFVLSGGGNRGALEAGVLLSLFESGIQPSILVGTSVGAVNASAIAIDPSLNAARWLADMWRKASRKDVMPYGYLSMLWRLVSGKSSLQSNQPLRDFLERYMPSNVRTFADLKKAELYITAVSLNTGNLHVFGLDPSDSIIDAIMASTAIPVFLSPWQYRDQRYVDGGVISDLPVRVAREMNATEIFAVDVGQHRKLRRSRRGGVLGVISQLLNAISYRRFIYELGWAEEAPRQDSLHYIPVDAFQELRIWDFSHTAEMIETGKRVGLDYIQRYNLEKTLK